MKKVAVNDFVRRQVKGTGKTYSPNLTFAEIADHAETQMATGNYKEGYRDGIRVVNGSADIAKHFICPFTKIDNKFKLNTSISLNENFLIAINNTEISVLNGNNSMISFGDVISIISVSHGG